MSEPTSQRASRRIALIVDNPRRDLAGLVLLGRELTLRGHEVVLVPMNLRKREVPALAPDDVVVNYLRPNNEDSVEALQDAGVRVSVLDTEGAVFDDIEALAVKLSKKRSALDRVHVNCAWGTFVADYLVEKGYYRPEQVVVCGPPRMDFYVEPYAAAAVSVSPAADLAEGPMVLICGSFPFANAQFHSPETIVEMRVANTGLDEAHVRAELAKDKAGLDGFIAMTQSLAVRCPDVRFVFRPHPFENIAVYERAFADLANVEVIAAGVSVGWVLRASAVVQPADCTTGVEAAFAGVASYIASWIPGDVAPVVESVSTTCSSEEELADELTAVLARPSGDERRLNDLVRSLFGPVDGAAHLRVADALDAPGAERLALDEEALEELHYFPSGRDGASLVARLRHRLGLPALWSLRRRQQVAPDRWDAGEKSFGASDVERLLEALDRACPDDRGAVRAEAAQRALYRHRYAVGRSVVLTQRG